ncbi:MAG: HAMP domain-containing sensor histidine kinase [Gemmatimonadaceae bacterium]
MSSDALRLHSGDFPVFGAVGNPLFWPGLGNHAHEASANANQALSPVLSALHYAAAETAAEMAGNKSELREELQAKFAKVAEAVSTAVAGNHAASVDRLLRLRDIEAIRTAFVRNLQAQPTAGVNVSELLAVLGAFDRMNCIDRLDVQSNQFTEHLAGPQALEAVVEMAHDIRSPLSSILFLVDAIRRSQSGSINAVQERQLGLIYGAALGLSTLASDVIDAVRGERLVDGSPVPFSVAEVMFGVRAIVRPIGEEKQLQIEMTLPNNDGRIGYPSAISRVLLNLVTNAVRYTDKGKVSIGCTEEGPDTLEFWIEDTGRGIPPGVLDTLFDGFRPWAAGMRFSNAGLGLAICRNLLTAMKSKLEVETALEKGTRFSFRLQLPIA